MMQTVILAPIHNSLYARLLTSALVEERGIDVCAVVVRSHWNIQRIRSEFSRDGARLVKKFIDKYLLGDDRFSSGQAKNNLSVSAEKSGLSFPSLKDLTKAYQIPYFKVPDFNQAGCVRFIQNLSPQVILFTGGGLIRKELLEVPETGVLNCHSGILPFYRGMDVVEWTAAEKNIVSMGFGATLHFMDSGVDTGPILLTEKIELHSQDTFLTIREKLEVLMLKLMLRGVKGLRDGKISPKMQKKSAGRQYFVMHPRIKTYAEINLERATKRKSSGTG